MEDSPRSQMTYRDARRRSSACGTEGGEPPSQRPRRKRYRFIILMVVLLCVVCAVAVYARPIAKLAAKVYLSLKLSKSHLTGQEGANVKQTLATVSPDPNKSVNTLILGSDAGSEKGESGYCRSDVMMLVCLQERDKKALVISIPRDTMVQIAGYGTQKINAAHAYKGPSGAIQAVKSLLGMDVHHYISMQFSGFEQIVNALGGIPIHLNKPVDDPHSGYLPAGDLKLDGWQALVLVRSRNMPNGDLDRIESQHAFLKALVTKAESMKSVWTANKLVNIVASNCKMDYSAGQLMDLALELRGFSPREVQFVTVPGAAENVGGVSYYVPNANLLTQMTDAVESRNWIEPSLLSKLQDQNVSSPAKVLNAPNADVVTVLSGSSTSAPAVYTVARELKLLGHQQVVEGQAKQTTAATTVYYRSEAKANYKEIVKSIPELSKADAVEDQEVPTSYNSPVVIVLGSRFTTPAVLSLYGRICQPALNFDNLGEVVHSFRQAP